MSHASRGEPRLPEHDLGAPRRAMLPEHGLSAPRVHFLHSHAPRALLNAGQKLVFATFFKREKSSAQLHVETLPINIKPFFYNYSFRTKWFKRMAGTKSFKGGVSLSSLQVSLGYVLCLL